MLGSNVKVHFAGSDGSKENFCALVAADTRYRLYSCYNYIVNKKPDDDFRLPEDDIILEQQKQQKHVIQDSGLFTLMFGASKGQQQTISTLTEWQEMLKLALEVENNLVLEKAPQEDATAAPTLMQTIEEAYQRRMDGETPHDE